MHEDGEMPCFVLRSKQDEYVFTDRALIHLDGSSALSKKRLVSRYLFSRCVFSDVRIETAGTVDLDCEIKFVLGGQAFSLDVQKKELVALTALYKALNAIADIQATGLIHLELSKLALERAVEGLGKGAVVDAGAGKAPGAAITEAAAAAYGFLADAHARHKPGNFGPVFARYLNRTS